MRKFKGNSDNDESMSSKIAKEEHFVSTNQAFKDPNAIYIEDNPQKALEQLLNVSKNQNYKEKLQYVKHIAELLDVIGDEGTEKLNQIISPLIEDKDEIKRALLTQISPLITLLQKKGDKGYQVIVDVMVPTVSKLINSNNIDIKEASGLELTKIAAILTEDDRGKHLLTIVLGMAHDDESEDNRMIAVRLLSQMAPTFGKDLCEQFVGLEFLSMGEDPQLRVRKEAVANLPSIAKVVSPHFFRQRLLPFYLKLCKDANWGVRKSCIDIIYEIANICKGELKEVKEGELTEMTLSFLKDSNKWVKVSAYKNLGPFISTLQGLKVHDRLVDSYLHMTDNNINNLAPENEIIHACAYNFPAVVLTLGPAKWPILAKLFQTLMKSNDKVKKPLACSLHEIAKIIGEEKAEKDLLGALERFLHDANDDIKYGAIQNLALFLSVFNIEKRENMVDIFLDLQRDQKKWRIRELIAQQIDKLTQVFPPEITFRIIAPISFKLCNDSVAFVREEAAKKVYAIVKALYNSEEIYRDSIIENIKGFSQSNRYTNRQAFASMCERLMKYPDIFKEHFLQHLIPLADDRVPNVRISVAKTLYKLYKKKRQLCSDPQIIQLVRKLKNDPSKDVKSFIIQIDIPNGEADQENADQVKQPEETKTDNPETSKVENKEESKDNVEQPTEASTHHEESHIVPVDEETAHKVEVADDKDDHLEVPTPPTTHPEELRKKSAELELEKQAKEEGENKDQAEDQARDQAEDQAKDQAEDQAKDQAEAPAADSAKAEESENKASETEATEPNGAQGDSQTNNEEPQAKEEATN